MNLKKVIKSNLLLFVVVAIAVCVIFYRFALIPKQLAFDEVEFAKLALSLKSSPYSVYSTFATGHSTLYFYSLLLSFNLFGISNFALRLPAAIYGVLGVGLSYLILKKSLVLKEKNISNILALGGAITFLTSHWYLNFARFSFEATFLIFLELTSIYFLFRFRESKSQTAILLSALFAGLAFNSYYPGRIFFLIPLVSFIYLKTRPKLILLFLVGFLVVSSPLIIYLSFHRDIRISEQLYLNNPHLSPSEKMAMFTENTIKTALMFNIKGDANGRHNYPEKPALNPILGLLFIAGLILSFRRLRHYQNFTFISLFLISLVPSLLTYPQENPHMLRTVTSIFPVIYFVTLAVTWIIQTAKSRFRNIVFLILLTLFLGSTIYELRTYFHYQTKVFNKAFEIQNPLPKALTQPYGK